MTLRRLPPAPVRRRVVRRFAIALALGASTVGSVADARAQRPAPDPEIWLAPLRWRGTVPELGAPLNVSRHVGYDNQPSFSRDGDAVFFTRQMPDAQTDIMRYDLRTGIVAPVARTAESEYSAWPIDDEALAVVRVEADSAQRLWRLPLDGGAPSLLVRDVRPVGYFAFADEAHVAMFVLGQPASLRWSVPGRDGSTPGARDIGRSIQRVPGARAVSWVQKGATPWQLVRSRPDDAEATALMPMPDGREDHAWLDSTHVIVGDGSRLLVRSLRDPAWRELADVAFAGARNISRLAVHPNGQYVAFVAERGPVPGITPATADAAFPIDTARLIRDLTRDLSALAADSMAGRATATAGGERAARYLADAYRAAGLQPFADSAGFRQRVPLRRGAAAMSAGAARRAPAPRPVASFAAWDSLAADDRLSADNVVGVIPGNDPSRAGEVIVLSAHYDHVGIGPAVNGDSIYNGADDDASGTVAMLAIARELARGPRPARTIVVLAATGEEVGLLGTRWYLAHPVRPLAETVLNLNFEMLGRPDSLIGRGRAWLTGYERSTLMQAWGDAFGIGPDLRPANRFFERSDNIAFARAGIVAHTLSSYGLHTDYHRPTDEFARIDVAHLAAIVADATRLVRRVANEPSKPAWVPGGRP